MEWVDSSFEDPFFVVFGLEGVSLKAGANMSVSAHPCRLHWSESVLPGLYEGQQLKKRTKKLFQP